MVCGWWCYVDGNRQDAEGGRREAEASFILPSINSFINSLCMHSFMRSLIHAFINWCVHSFMHLFLHSCAHSLIPYASIHSCIHSCILSFIHALVHSFILAFTHPCIALFKNSPMHSIVSTCFPWCKQGAEGWRREVDAFLHSGDAQGDCRQPRWRASANNSQS